MGIFSSQCFTESNFPHFTTMATMMFRPCILNFTLLCFHRFRTRATKSLQHILSGPLKWTLTCHYKSLTCALKILCNLSPNQALPSSSWTELSILSADPEHMKIIVVSSCFLWYLTGNFNHLLHYFSCYHIFDEKIGFGTSHLNRQ